MKEKNIIKVCFSKKTDYRDIIEWERFWEVTNESDFGRDNVTYHVAINNSMPISEFMNIGREVKEIIEYRNKCSVGLCHNGVNYDNDGMISEISFYFQR